MMMTRRSLADDEEYDDQVDNSDADEKEAYAEEGEGNDQVDDEEV